MGRYFGVSPVELLRYNHFEWALITAAYDVASKAEAAAAKKK